MPRNLVLFTSTNTQEYYDVNVCYGANLNDEIGGFFSSHLAARRYEYKGRLTMMQILHMLWPMLWAVGVQWQEWYVYQNSYGRDRPLSATIQTRHSLCADSWMQRIVGPMGSGRYFYKSFWNFVAAPVWLVRDGLLNRRRYQTLGVVGAPGPHEWLWPCLREHGPESYYALVDFIDRTIGSDHRVPKGFIVELAKLFSRWLPRNRM
jgi:hypothetical protein